MTYFQLHSDSDLYIENDMINIIASLTLQIPPFVSSLFNLGYKIVGIEKGFRNDINTDVKFDIVLNAIDENVSIAWECKGGQNTNAYQLEKYNNLTKNELVRELLESSVDIDNHDMNISIMCNNSHFEHLRIGVENRYSFPIVTVSKENGTIKLMLNKFHCKCNCLNETFRMIKISEPIPQVIRFTEQTKPSEIANTLFQNILSFSLKDNNNVNIEKLCEETIGVYEGIYAIIGMKFRKAIRNKIKAIITEVSTGQLKEYLSWNGASKEVTIKRLNSRSSNGVVQFYLQSVEDYITELRVRENYNPRALHDQIDMEDNVL